MATLIDLFILRGPPEYIKSDYGPEFIARKVCDWIEVVGAKTTCIELCCPWKIGYCESLNARFRDELRNGEIFYGLRKSQILIEQWQVHDNTVRPNSSLGYRPSGARTHRSDGPEADDAPTIKPDHLIGVRRQRGAPAAANGVDHARLPIILSRNEGLALCSDAPCLSKFSS